MGTILASHAQDRVNAKSLAVPYHLNHPPAAAENRITPGSGGTGPFSVISQAAASSVARKLVDDHNG